MYIETIFGRVCTPSTCHDELSYLTVKTSFQKLEKSRQTGGWTDGQTHKQKKYIYTVGAPSKNE